MSPEQAWLTETSVDHRTDVYSLGVTLYEALSGTRPFDGANVLEVFEKIKTSLPPSVRHSEGRISKDGSAVTAKAMSRLPADRYATAEELAEDLRHLSKGGTTIARLERGHLLNRAWTQVRFYCSGHPYEFQSRRKFLGLPLVHIVAGRRLPGQPMRRAKGWLAVGDIAIGGIAFGGFAIGGIACGGISAGLLFSWGGIALALLVAMGGIAVGSVSMGGVALGYLALGGLACGYIAVGGFVRGVYAMGGDAEGRVVITEAHQDMTEEQFWQESLDWFFRLFGLEG